MKKINKSTIMIILFGIFLLGALIYLGLYSEVVKVKTTPIQAKVVNKFDSPGDSTPLPTYHHAASFLVIFTYYNSRDGINSEDGIDSEELYNRVKKRDTITLYKNDFITRGNKIKYTEFTLSGN